MTEADYEILSHAMNGGKPPPHAVRLLEDVCERTGVSWKARGAYLMQRGGKWSVTLSIDGFRAIAASDPDYGGQEGPLWTVSADGAWTDVPPDAPPYAAKVGVKHRGGVTTWGVAKYKDYEAGPMWKKFPSTMIAKCAEMLALRKAFPGRLGGLYGTEEMAQASEKADKPKPAPAPPPPNAAEGDWMRELDLAAAKDIGALAAVVEVGRRIKEDKSLAMEDILRLHAHYTRLKKNLE